MVPSLHRESIDSLILVCALFCRAIVLDGCCSCKLLSDACTHQSSLLLLTYQGKGTGTEPLQIVPDLTNTSNFFTHVRKHPTDRGSINKQFVTCWYLRIVWVLLQVPCSFTLWYNSYIPACLIAPRLVYTHYGCVDAVPTIESQSTLSPEPLITAIVGIGMVSISMSALTCSKLCHVTLLDKCPQ